MITQSGLRMKASAYKKEMNLELYLKVIAKNEKINYHSIACIND